MVDRENIQILLRLDLTIPLEVSQALEKNWTYGSSRPGEVLEAHIAQLPPVKVKVLEGNARGINLVHV